MVRAIERNLYAPTLGQCKWSLLERRAKSSSRHNPNPNAGLDAFISNRERFHSSQRITFTPFHRNREKGTRKDCDFARPIFSAGEVACSREQQKEILREEKNWGILVVPVMVDPKTFKMAAFRLEALRRGIPDEITEDHVIEYHRLLRELQDASGEDLSVFRIRDDEVQRRIVRSLITVLGAPAPPPVYTQKKHCDRNLFSRQVEALWCCVQHLQSDPNAPPPHPKDYWNMSDAELEQLAKKYGMGEFGHQNWAKSRQTIISQLVMRDQSLEPKTPTSTHTITVGGNMNGSVIQQGSPHAQANVQFNVSEIRETIEKIKEVLPGLPISNEAKEELQTDIQTIEPQLLSARPKVGIVKACLASMKSILQEATAHTAAILLAHEIASHLEKIAH